MFFQYLGKVDVISGHFVLMDCSLQQLFAGKPWELLEAVIIKILWVGVIFSSSIKLL
jgi:hypothetical protein